MMAFDLLLGKRIGVVVQFNQLSSPVPSRPPQRLGLCLKAAKKASSAPALGVVTINQINIVMLYYTNIPV